MGPSGLSEFDEPAAQWLQVYKKKNKSNSWLQFVLVSQNSPNNTDQVH